MRLPKGAGDWLGELDGTHFPAPMQSKLRKPKLAALALYVLISVILFGLPVALSPATAHVGFENDPSSMIWCMAWWPYSIGHGLNPFITNAVWAPAGYNLTWAASIPAVAIALAPITLALGPVVSYNLAALLAPALSAWGAFLLCRRATGKIGAALAGGLLYGFSPYEVGHVLGGHLNLTAIFVPPLCVLLVLLLADCAVTRRVFIAGFAFLLVIQCLISTEILATMTLVGGAAFVAAIALMPGARRFLLTTIVPISSAYLIAAMVLGPFLYYALATGSVPKEPIIPPGLVSADLLSFVVPTPLMLICPPGARNLYSQFAGNAWEICSYLGMPILAAAGVYFWACRHEPVARLLALVLFTTVLAALGPVLQINGRPIMPLPWAAAGALPLMKNAMPARLVSYSFLALSVIVSLWLSGPPAKSRRVLILATLIALLPNPQLLRACNRYHTPAFFAQALYRNHIRQGANVLVIPYGFSGPSMAWQAESAMYFRMPGGYLGPTPEVFQRWPLVNMLLTSIPAPESVEQLKAFVSEYQIDAIVVADDAQELVRELPQALGIVPIKTGGVSFYPLPHNLAVSGASPNLDRFQREAAAQWSAGLLCAADRFLASGRPLAALSSTRAHDLGLLPDSKWYAKSLDLFAATFSHGGGNGLWLGPGADGTIAMGIFGSGSAIKLLVSQYGAAATSTLYPYPYNYSDLSPSDHSVHFMLMTLRPEVAHRSCLTAAKWQGQSTAPPVHHLGN